MPNWAQNGPKWSKTCYIDHLGSFWALLDRFGTSASLPCSAIFGPKRAIMIRGSQKGGWGGGSDVWEKFPNNILFFLRAYLKNEQIIKGSDLRRIQNGMKRLHLLSFYFIRRIMYLVICGREALCNTEIGFYLTIYINHQSFQ